MADVREREKIAREIEKTSESIRKKHLKTGRIEKGIALDRHFKPLIEPLRLFVNSPSVHATKRESRNEDATSASKREGGTGTKERGGGRRSERDVRAFHDSA